MLSFCIENSKKLLKFDLKYVTIIWGEGKLLKRGAFMKRLISFLAVCLVLPNVLTFAAHKEVYNSAYGVKYHYDKHCSGKYPKKITLDEALKRYLKACKKCVLKKYSKRMKTKKVKNK